MDRDVAYKKLLQCLEKVNSGYSSIDLPISIKSALEAIILGEHLTFRYILITAILAKSVEPSVHARSLQAQAPLHGAYDARSLCHYVVVPFERKELSLRLGGSNEPYLNKPARFVSIEKTNPVRGGRDKILLGILYDVLEEVNHSNSSIIDDSLTYAISLILKRDAKFSSTIDTSNIQATQTTLFTLLNSIQSICSGGESAVIVAGALLRVMYKGQATVRISPVNQAGSSSKEVGDIDLIQNGKVFCAIEVKDKIFTEYDILHATRIAREANINRLIFIIGCNVPSNTIPNIDSIIQSLAKEGFDISFSYVQQFSELFSSLLDHDKRQDVINEVPNIVDEIRASDMTKQHIDNIFSKIKLNFGT